MTKSGKHCGKRRNCSFRANSSFVTMFSNAAEASESVYMREGLLPSMTRPGIEPTTSRGGRSTTTTQRRSCIDAMS